MKIPQGETINFNGRDLYDRVWAMAHGLDTCYNCQHRSGQYCAHPKIEEMARQWGCINDTKLPEGFGCIYWSNKT